jgi:hypothetical protein
MAISGVNFLVWVGQATPPPAAPAKDNLLWHFGL